MKRALFLLVLAACGSKPPAKAPEPAPPPVAAAHADPTEDIDAEKVAEALPRHVNLALHTKVMRGHPTGKKMGPMLLAMPIGGPMRPFAKNPVHGFEWVHISGPSLMDTSGDAFLFAHARTEEELDAEVDALAAKDAASRPIDVAPPGRAMRISFAGSVRGVVRAQKGIVGVVPTAKAKEAARHLTHARPRTGLGDREAMRMWIDRPHRLASQIPESVKTARVWIVAEENGGVDARAEGQCDDETSARAVALTLKRLIASFDGFVVRMLTKGILSRIAVESEGSTVKIHLPASAEQVEAVIGMVAATMGIDIDAK